MAKYRCMICEHIYDEEDGDPWNGINPTTTFEELPEDYSCPICAVSKDRFRRLNEDSNAIRRFIMLTDGQKT